MNIGAVGGMGYMQFPAGGRVQNSAPAAQPAQDWFAAQSGAAAQPAAARLGPDGTMTVDEAKARAKVEDNAFKEKCRTCAERRYQDGSDDPSVSFQTPQHIDPGNSAAVVSSHEQEHVVNERANAELDGGKVVMQSVVLHGDICPECGTFYVAGGTTRTTTSTPAEGADARQGAAQGEGGEGTDGAQQAQAS